MKRAQRGPDRVSGAAIWTDQELAARPGEGRTARPGEASAVAAGQTGSIAARQAATRAPDGAQPLASAAAPHRSPSVPELPVLTDEQRRAVEWGEGPLMVLAGAGTGKTTVIVERVAWLLGRHAPAVVHEGDADGRTEPAPTAPDRDPLEPENILVLTYNVRAAAELVERFERRLGPDVAGRLWVQNFHSLGLRILRDNAAAANLPDQVEVLDSVGQRLFLNELRADLDLVYHQFYDLRGQLGHLADLVNRARDELVTPAEYRAHAESRRAAFEARHGPGSYLATIAELRELGDLKPIREVRRALVRNGEADAGRAADREARRAAGGNGRALAARQLSAEQRAVAEGLRSTFLRDAEALEVLRLEEEATVYAAYLSALRERAALDFGDQILRAIALLEERPNILRRYQRQFRHILVDEFQDANVAQIMLLELLGRAPDRPDNVVVVGDDDQSIYRFRGASYAAFEQFRERFGRPPAWDPTRPTTPVAETSLLLNRRSAGNILSAASRLVARNEGRLKREPLLAGHPPGDPVELIIAADEQDEAEAVVDAIQRAVRALPDRIERGGTIRARRWSDVAVLYRKHRHREAIARRLRAADIPFTVVGSNGLFEHPDVRDVESALRAAVNPADSVSVTRLLAAAPWHLDATEILHLTRAAQFDGTSVFEIVAYALREHALPVEIAPPADGDGNGAVDAPVSRDDPAAILQLSLLPPETAGASIEATRHERQRPAARTPRFQPAPLRSTTRAKLQLLMDCVGDLATRARRDGPFTLLEDYLVRTNLLHDLISTGTPEAQRSVLALARFMRFVSDWQRDHSRETLAEFVHYLDLYQEVGGDVDTDAGVAEIDGVQLMTVHQAKGLEWEIVVVPRLVDGQFPDDRAEDLAIPIELLRQQPPPDFQEAEERRLCYVAMTRARRRLVLVTIDAVGSRVRPSRFVTEIAPWAHEAEAPGRGSVGAVPEPLPDEPDEEPDETPGWPEEEPSPPAQPEFVPRPIPAWTPPEEPVTEPWTQPAREPEFEPDERPGFAAAPPGVVESGAPRSPGSDARPLRRVGRPSARDVVVVRRRPVDEELAAQLPAAEPNEPATGGPPVAASTRAADSTRGADGATGNGLVALRGGANGDPVAAEAARTTRITDELTRRLPVPTAFERRFALRRRAVELIGLLEHVGPADAAARDALIAELIAVATDAARAAAEQHARGLDPLTLRVVAADSDAGAELLRLVPLPERFSHTAFTTYRECPLQYAFQRVYQIPVPDELRRAYFTFGSIVHEAFEAFGRAQHEARAAGLPEPDESDLQRAFERAWQPLAFPDRVTAETYRTRGPAVLRNFYARQLSRLAESVCFEQAFRLVLDPGDGSPPAQIVGAIDRIDRLPDGTLELIDYKTGHPKSQADVDADEQLSTYALAMREGAVLDPATNRPLPAPSRLTLYFTESDEWITTTRSDAQLDAHRARLLDLVGRIRSGNFVALPELRKCERCDYRRICPSRWGSSQ